jgi:hypothetical protein
MHALRLGVAMLMLGLAVGQEARAGIYILDREPKSPYALDPPYRVEGKPAPWDRVRDWRADLASVLVDPRDQAKNKDQPNLLPTKESELRLAHGKQAEELLEKRKHDGALSPTERVSLGGCLLRLGRQREAMEVLREGERMLGRDEPARFLLLLNLATAYQQSDDPTWRPLALVCQAEALKASPDQWRAWNPATWEWYRWAEKYNLELMRLREREKALNPWPDPGSAVAPDALFPRVRFTGPTGKYEVGSIALDQWNELPRDAESLVVQLMIWQPQDPRLFWLYGELLNARGEVKGAYEVLNTIARSGNGWPELGQHRRALLEAQKPETVAIPPAPAPPEYPTMPDWRALTIGFLVGVVVAVLSVFQLREWRRRAPVAHPPGSQAEWERTDLPPPIGSPNRDGSEATGITRPTREEGPRV